MSERAGVLQKLRPFLFPLFTNVLEEEFSEVSCARLCNDGIILVVERVNPLQS